MPRTNNWTVRHLRRAASLKLVEMTAGGSWVECAALLDIPVGRAKTALAVLRHQAAGTDLWTDFEAAVERIARDLDSNPRRITPNALTSIRTHPGLARGNGTSLTTSLSTPPGSETTTARIVGDSSMAIPSNRSVVFVSW